MIRALTLIQPWAYAVAESTKRIENRTWKPPQFMIGHHLAIHAGKGMDWDTAQDLITVFGLHMPTPMIHGAIVAVARLTGYITANDAAAKDIWFQGPYGWTLDAVIPIEPVTCPGKLGLWVLPDPVLDKVRINYVQALLANFERETREATGT